SDLDIFLYIIVPALVRALRALADHCLTAFCPPWPGCVKIFRHAARRAVAVRSANSAADQTEVRVAQSSQEKTHRGADDLPPCYQSGIYFVSSCISAPCR